MRLGTTLKSIADRHRLKSVSKLVVRKGGEKLLGRPAKRVGDPGS